MNAVRPFKFLPSGAVRYEVHKDNTPIYVGRAYLNGTFDFMQSGGGRTRHQNRKYSPVSQNIVFSSSTVFILKKINNCFHRQPSSFMLVKLKI